MQKTPSDSLTPSTPNPQVSAPTNSHLNALINPKNYLDSANSFTGKLSFNLPLIIFEQTDGSTSSIHLTYNPLQKSHNQIDLGSGWGISKNCIRFDPAARQYSITIQGTEFLLNQKKQANEATTIAFAVANSRLVILLNPTQANFRVFKTGGYTQTYTKDSSLENTWLLSEESFPDSSKITYSYTITGNEAYLNQVSHSNQQQMLKISYQVDAIFKIKSLEMQTRDGTQTAVDIEISNSIISFKEREGQTFSLLSYDETTSLISSVTLPCLNISFKYDLQPIKSAISADQSYSIQGSQSQIFYEPNSDYMIGAYINDDGMLIIEKCEGNDFQITASGNVGYSKRYPPLSLEFDEIASYSILAQQEHIIVLLNGSNGGKVFLFNAALSTDSSVFQEVGETWDVPVSGIIDSWSQGFYFVGPNGCQVFFKQEEEWQIIPLLSEIPFPSIVLNPDESGAWICTASSLFMVPDLTKPLENNQVISDAKTDWLSDFLNFAKKLSCDSSTQLQIKSLFSQRILRKSGNFMVMSSLGVPEDSSTPFYTKVQCFESQEGRFQPITAIDDPTLFFHDDFSALSKTLFPTDLTAGEFTFRRAIFFSASAQVFQIRTRNITILPDEQYVDKSLADIDWTTGISYSIKKPMQLSQVIKGLAQRIDLIDYSIKKNDENYELSFSNTALKSALNQGEYTFRIKTKDNKIIDLQPARIEDQEIKVNCTQNGRTESITATADNKYKSLFVFIQGLYTGSDSLSPSDFCNFIESDQDLPSEVACAVAEMTMRWFATVDNRGKVSCKGWEMNNFQTSPQINVSTPISDHYFLEKINGKVSLFQTTDPTNPLVDFPVDSVDEIMNFYPSCLAYDNHSQIELLSFIPSEDGNALLPSKEPTPFKRGQLSTESSFPFNPFFTLAVKEIASAGQSALSLYKTQELIQAAVKEDWVVSEQLNQSSDKEEVLFQYHSPWQYQENQISYRSFTKISVVNRASQGKTVTSLAGNRVETTIYNSDGTLLETNQSEMREIAVKEPSSPKPNFSPPNSLTSQLQSATGGFSIAMIEGAFFEAQEADFMSFQPYETGRIGKQEAKAPLWQVTKGAFVQGWCLSGQQYLRLQSGGALQVVYKPDEMNKIFTVGIWVRSTIDFDNYSPLNISFTSSSNCRSAVGEVKNRHGKWNYFEALLSLTDLPTENEEGNITVKVTPPASSSTSPFLDVDALIFAPMGCPMKGRVFDSELRAPTGVFDSRGSYQQLIYTHQQLVGITRPNGSIQGVFAKWNPHTDVRVQKSLMPPTLRSDLSVAPSNGFVEDADPKTIHTRWKLNRSNWELTPSTLTHRLPGAHVLRLLPIDHFSTESMGCSLECANLTSQSTLTFHFGSYSIPLSLLDWSTNDQSVSLLALRLGARFILFTNGQLVMDELHDGSSSSSFAIEVVENAVLKNLMVFTNPQVTLCYQNLQGHPLQRLLLLNAAEAQLTINSYDSLGRNQQSGVPIVVNADSSDHLLTYRSPLPITPSQNLQYDLSPLANVSQVGFSDSEYAPHPSCIVRGPFSVIKKKLSHLAEQLAPWVPLGLNDETNQYIVIQDPDEVFNVAIQNKEGLLLASYRQITTGFIQNQFSYQEGSGQLTRHRLPRSFVLEFGGSGKMNQGNFERTLAYTPDGQLDVTKDPDYGVDLMIHDPKSCALRFQVHYNNEGQFNFLLLFDYDTQGCINYVGYHSKPRIELEGNAVDLNDQEALKIALKTMAPIDVVPPSIQTLMAGMTLMCSAEVAHYSPDLNKRGRLQNTFTQQFLKDGLTQDCIGGTLELFTHGLSGLILNKERIVGGDCHKVSYDYNVQGYLSSIVYPTFLDTTSKGLIYEYDSLQRISAIRTADKTTTFAEFEYVAGTTLISVERLPIADIVRTYAYNPLNQLISITDGYLDQDLTYTTKAFQEKQIFKQLIASSTFAQSWIKKVPKDDTKALEQLTHQLYQKFPSQISDVDKLVFILIDKGYVNKSGFLTRPIDLHSVYDLPTEILDLSQVVPILQQQPSLFKVGHQYAYEFADQLTKAKFISGEQDLPLRFSPLAIESFLQIDPALASQLYTAFTSKGYVTEDGIWTLNTQESLEDALKSDDGSISGASYLKAHPIGVRNLLLNQYLEKNPLPHEVFQFQYLTWTNTPLDLTNPITKDRLKEADEAWKWLQLNGFIDSEYLITEKMISPDILNLVEQQSLQNRIVDIVNLIHFYQMQAIGESANDLWIFGEDVHGNMSKYYVGSSRVSLSISSQSNQLLYILKDFEKNPIMHSFTHDGSGNLNCAPHLGITTLLYDPISQRPTWIEMDSGMTIQLSYDSKGFRSLKRVSDPEGNWSEVCYLRNEEGRVISEWHTNKEGKSSEVSYIHGPRGLVGFVRDGNAYSVLKDHQGSIRIVLDDKKEVVFSTHYLPYGQRTHIYGDPNILSYGYIGQELDVETGLYNLNARLYDPQLGRFYQVDPARQYASPYLYTGNSPLSFQDSTGLFSWKAFGGGVISGLEVAAGVSLDILSGGALAEGIGGALIGAGVSGMIYTIETGDNFSWNAFGKEEGIGAATGLLTAGFGSVEGSIVEKMGTQFAEDSFERLAAETATKMVARSVTGMMTGTGQSILENLANGRSWDDNLENAVWIGALTGASSAGIGAAGESLGRNAGLIGDDASGSILSKGFKSFAAGAVSGFAGDAAGTMVVNSIQGEPLDSGLWQASIGNVVGGVTACGHTINPDRPPLISRGLKYESISVETNCLAVATFKSMERQGILGTINAPETLRSIAAKTMEDDLKDNPENFREKFKATLANMVESGDIQGLSSDLQDLSDHVRLKMAEEGETAKNVLDSLDSEDLNKHIHAYIASIKSGTVWGNFLELDYLGIKLGLKFRVNMRGEKWSSIGASDADHSIFLRYSGDHYDAYFKQGVAFFSPKRRYVPLGEESGFGAGKRARESIEGSTDDSRWTKLNQAQKNELNQRIQDLREKILKPLDFARELKRDPMILDASNESFILDLVNRGGSYKELKDTSSFQLLVESNHMPPWDVVKDTFETITQNDVSCVSMQEPDHRKFPSTGRGRLLSDVKDAVATAIENSALPAPTTPITTADNYRAYLKGLYSSSDQQKSYADMMDIEIRVKQILFPEKYIQGIEQSINYAFNQGYINELQQRHLMTLL